MFDYILIGATIILSLSILVSLYRVIKGPSMPDRIVALDTIGINLIGIVAIVSMLLHTQAFLEVILLLGILAFIGTVAFSKFLEKGVVIERDRDQ
ncbi:Na(+)/H(+) antiporter subunit F1 [Alkalihalobacillus sp. BA299]|uniref:Na(+)/H(+) antiporter subunit F1 n=1 Tax=Alkalihalobacillus sp. BA299 TaxID=2815938 RepID=UPI001ADC521D|nr:Na(+)/H(+) antiporter subunit F1 [Alkalihalobacillus sp. BA299]